MKLDFYPFTTVNWNNVIKEVHNGISGSATWQVQQLNSMRVRIVEYSPGYLADHWCSKGHIIFCYEGEMQTELFDGRIFKMEAGMSYFVGDKNEAHRSSTQTGCKLFIVD